MQEETGHLVTIGRLIGIQEHAWMVDSVCCDTHEINLVFRMHSTTLKFGLIPDTRESHVAFAWVPMDEWASVDMRPVALKAMISQEGPLCFLSNLFSDSKTASSMGCLSQHQKKLCFMRFATFFSAWNPG